MSSIHRESLGLSATLVTLGLLACGGAAVEPPQAEPSPVGDPPEAAPVPAEAPGLPEGHPVTEASSLQAVTRQAMAAKGVVQETLEGGGYTYARVLLSAEEIWVAGPATPLEVGTEIALAGAMPMGEFSSPSLGRSFDNLYFVAGFGSLAPPPDADAGEAVEVLNGGGYTYVRAKLGEEEIWLAGPQTEIQKGETVHWKNGMEMGQFTSSSLGRTFDNILFVGRFWVTPG